MSESSFVKFIGLVEQRENKSFFGSKCMILPNEIEISNIKDLPIELDSDLNFNNINKSNSTILYYVNENITKINIIIDLLFENFFIK